jgi:transcription-repair coupling factor (superfamily II helicase)
VDAARIIALIQKSREYKLSGPDRLKIQVRIPGVEQRVARVRSLLNELSK